MREGTTDNSVVSSLCQRGDDGDEPGGRSRRRDSFGVATLLELFDGDRDAIASLLAAALASIERDLATIESGARAGDRPAIGEAAHRIKGTSGSIGAGTLVEISTRIEAVTRTPGEFPPATILELRLAVDEVRAGIADFVRTSGPSESA
jgi:HPt (histidine-containing phosphotransfer) domain-containing protein